MKTLALILLIWQGGNLLLYFINGNNYDDWALIYNNWLVLSIVAIMVEVYSIICTIILKIRYGHYFYLVSIRNIETKKYAYNIPLSRKQLNELLTTEQDIEIICQDKIYHLLNVSLVFNNFRSIKKHLIVIRAFKNKQTKKILAELK